MQRVGKVVLQPHGGPTAPIMKLLIPTEAVQLAEESTQAAFRQVVGQSAEHEVVLCKPCCMCLLACMTGWGQPGCMTAPVCPHKRSWVHEGCVIMLLEPSLPIASSRCWTLHFLIWSSWWWLGTTSRMKASSLWGQGKEPLACVDARPASSQHEC